MAVTIRGRTLPLPILQGGMGVGISLERLAGAVAARTAKPVIGIPVAASALGGMDALLAPVQMPPGFPVATVALDKAGARNAAWLAAQILALNDPALAGRIVEERRKMKDAVEKAARDIEEKYGA